MSVKETPYYWVTCDNCGIRADYGARDAMDTPDAAIDRAVTAGWSEQGSRHHCPNCPVIPDADS
jgi:hypothetical protein